MPQPRCERDEDEDEDEGVRGGVRFERHGEPLWTLDMCILCLPTPAFVNNQAHTHSPHAHSLTPYAWEFYQVQA